MILEKRSTTGDRAIWPKNRLRECESYLDWVMKYTKLQHRHMMYLGDTVRISYTVAAGPTKLNGDMCSHKSVVLR